MRLAAPPAVPRTALLALLLAALTACGSDDAADPDADAGPIDAGVDAPDPTLALFAPDHLLEIAIEMPEAAWDDLRQQNRPADVLMGEDCQAQPFGSPFTAQLATVTIDGTRYQEVAVRKKGFLGSLDDDKPSLKIKLDEVIEQDIAGLHGLTLNNNKQDPSAVRQCLAFRRFAAAGVPAPRCNFAHVTINGRDLGIYTHVEAVGKPFLRRHFGDDSGRLYEGTLADFRTGWLATFEPKTDETNPDRSDLEALATALTAPDGQLLAALEPVVDVEKFLTFWAMETLIEHGDGYANNTNNFFVYREPASGRFHFIPWGVDGVAATTRVDPDARYVMADGLLARRLYLLPATRARYLAKLQSLLDTTWDAVAINADVDRMETLILPRLATDPFAIGRDVRIAIDDVQAFVATRRAQMAPTISTPPAWTRALRVSYCFVELGPVAATFATTFKNADPPDVFAAGTGTLTGTISGAPIVSMRVGTNAQPSDDGRVSILVFNQESGTDVLVGVVNVPPAAVRPGVTIPIDIFAGYLVRFHITTGTAEVVGVLLGGTIRFTQGGVTEGAPVAGSWDATLFRSPF